MRMHPDHRITVTRGVFGRAHVECSCGLARVCPSRWTANRVALLHHHEHAGCNCPPEVASRDFHPSPAPDAPSPAPGSAAASTTADAVTGSSIHCTTN
jgi:hypothetical protein